MIKKKYRQHKETVNNFFWRALQIFGKDGVTFLIFMISAKFLLPEDLGVFSYLLATVSLLIIFSDFGISTSVSKYVAEHIDEKDKYERILFSSSLVIIIISLFISIFLISFRNILFKDIEGILYFIPYLFLLPLSSVLDGIYRGRKDFKKLSAITIVTGIVSLIFSYFLISNFYLIGAIISQNILYLTLFLVLLFFNDSFSLKVDKRLLKKVFSYSLIIGLSNLAFFMYGKADIFILKYFGFLTEIAYYDMIDKIFKFIVMPAAILGQVIAPNISFISSKKKYKEINKKMNKYLMLIIPIGIVISITMYYLLPILLKTFLSEYVTVGFISILTILLILLPFKLWGVFCTNGFTIPAGFAKITLQTNIIFGLLNIILDIILVKRIGFIGIFWVTLIVHSLNIMFQLFYIKKKLKN